MHCSRLVFWLAFALYWCDGGADEANQRHGTPPPQTRPTSRSTYTMLSETISQAVNNENLHETCGNDDVACLTLASNDKLGLEAIRALHQQLDDDANGNIDLSETGDFLREDLKLDSGYEKRQKVFHYNDDMHISVKELWEAWLRSEVHNWTVEQTTDWLSSNVELPQYADNFIKHRVTGADLPRLAVNNMHYLSVLGIKDPIHKQKISLKAMDVVLFGPPKDSQHHWKDLILITLIIGGGIGLWYALQQNKKFRRHMNRMNSDMESLQSAEKALENMQKELEEAKIAQENVASEKEDLEKRLLKNEMDSSILQHSDSDLQISQLKAEIEILRTQLQIAEGELKDRCWSAPLGLQQWLQLTHEVENKSYIKKKIGAEKQLQQAREACEKLKKKRSSLVGAFVSTHGKSIDDVDRSIVEARTSLNEVTQELQERMHRWKQIEMLCGFNIINNNGLQSLENTLYRNGNRPFGMRGRMSSADDLDDESSSIYAPSAGPGDSGVWREMDSSGSEASKHEEEFGDAPRTNNGVKFQIGADSFEERVSTFRQSNRSTTNNSLASGKTVSGTQSQEKELAKAKLSTDAEQQPMTVTATFQQPSATLQQQQQQPLKSIKIRPKTIKEQSPGKEDDVYSTDSSVIDDEVKKKKRKLFGFGKKSKNKD